MKKTLASRKLQALAVLFLSVLLLWLFFRGTDLGDIRDAFWSADPQLIFWSLAVTMGTYGIRALRWQVLLSPLGRAGLVNCFSTTVIGFMVNFLAGRLGEIARPYLLARREGFSASGAFATIVLERVLDLVTVVLLVGLWLLAGPAPTGSDDVVAALELGGFLGLTAAVAALGAMFLFARYPERSLALARSLLRFLPHWIAARAFRFLETFRAGLGVLVVGSRLAQSLALSLVLWLNVCFAFWLAARAFDAEFSYGDTFLVIGFLIVGVAVPTPGAIGGYHYMCALALTTLFGIGAVVAKAVALAAHAISFVPVTLLGILLFARAGLSFREVDRMTSSEMGQVEPSSGAEDDRPASAKPTAESRRGSKSEGGSEFRSDPAGGAASVPEGGTSASVAGAVGEGPGPGAVSEERGEP